MSASFLALPATALYFVSGVMIGLRLFGSPDARKPSRPLGVALGLVAAALHAVLIWTQTLTDTGLNVAFFSVSSMVAWAIAVLVLLSSLNKPVENLGIVLLPLAGLAVLLAWRHPGFKLLPDSTPWALRVSHSATIPGTPDSHTKRRASGL